MGISGTVTADGNTTTPLSTSNITDWTINFSGSCSFCSIVKPLIFGHFLDRYCTHPVEATDRVVDSAGLA
jgi:hypothetical protein